ncbi:MAG TPA: hypothetical protein VFC26_10830, partial [Verrucomicrobiae bacterium]|nr:hypothetical protein [Verrucomicrobiae bacterium]
HKSRKPNLKIGITSPKPKSIEFHKARAHLVTSYQSFQFDLHRTGSQSPATKGPNRIRGRFYAIQVQMPNSTKSGPHKMFQKAAMRQLKFAVRTTLLLRV